MGRAVRAEELRDDVTLDDLAMILEQLAAVRLGNQARTAELRRRDLALVLDGLRAGAASPLPGAPPATDELNRRWLPAH